MGSVTEVAVAIAPLALLVALGVALRRGRFLDAAGWRAVDHLNHWLLFPALIFHSLASARSVAVGGEIAITVWGALAVVALAGFVVRLLQGWGIPVWGSVFQGAVRFNAFVALAVIPALLPGSASLVATLVALTVPVVNVACVLVHARFRSVAGLLRSLATNPLIVASLLGIVVQRTGASLGPLSEAFALLGSASLAAGLLSVGAALEFRHARSGWREVLVASALKFALLPAAAVAIAVVVGVAQEMLAPIALFHALPTASASFVLARALGGDERLMAAILAVQTVAAIAVLPLVFAATR
jgi:malonate transporter and related proteins